MWNPGGDSPEDLTRELARIQRYASGMQELLADAEARTPHQVDAVDRSEAVRVRLDQSGLPDLIEVVPDWQRWLAPEALGAAVVEAGNAAATRRLAIWSRAVNDSPWQERVDRLAVDADADVDLPAPAPVSAPGRAPTLSLDELMGEALYALDHLDEYIPAAPESIQGNGTDRTGELTLVLSKQGVMSCSADPRWLADQDGDALTYSFAEALRTARAALDRTERTERAETPASRLPDLFAEALANLQPRDGAR